ncbi:CRE-SECS-1 protein [Aphelenchoides avenae]|nr:CRE-SECS-1 protein [Aphelenchus avenae]
MAECSKSTTLLFENLWTSKKLPDEGWEESLLTDFMNWLSRIDSNNRVSPKPIGAGEREGRIACPLVGRLHFNMTHGVGRSGNVAEVQPKALGSSMMTNLTNELALQAIKLMGIKSCKGALVLPVATGMAMTLCMSAWRSQRPTARKVLWCRIDQKSCYKCILTAGFSVECVEPMRDPDSDSLVTDVSKVECLLKEDADNILCVITTTSCFAPRAPDNLPEVALLCKQYNVPHMVNNAYGLQSVVCCELLEKANEIGRVDCFVQSTDKNFQVPVGGSIVASFKRSGVDPIARIYPGRASAVPSRDVLLTLLHLGKDGIREILEQRQSNFVLLRTRMQQFARSIGERVLDVPQNLISIAVSLKTIPRDKQTLFGSSLFTRGITGARVVASTDSETTVDEGTTLRNFGSHSSAAHSGYLNVACAVGMTTSEVEELVTRLEHCYKRFLRKLHLSSDEPDAREAGDDKVDTVDIT